ncbi:UDP-N-acetylmuramoyl-L-alanyl-D-glutamate--2,6-diaminopimelate ligase [Microbulbifer thermotolerans]|uniref:UDP-N-acetylmuramoyl-L-alanyl-D-glutamate--2,6-diaminopimelate ligase n=1 Tax=Microbulbifer thermotolerans TaxID=252514 RepID=A0A143HK21_MICTH|nr:UDP-N-acetylmuramoyl-L-alanyl-D-glutamate--2,6-diaminopimelate ligase [Microbulbifer thermotolerans]AMX02058.1 UDP-N-acetylmuramoyl-L-alanyl-D-glutamate--2,6-diaminopimelate ligase [Microbulbifer thermotolerans]
MSQREKRAVSLKVLVPGYAGIPEVPVSGVALDSRLVQPGDVFMALRGTVVDGREYIAEAIAAGAAAVLADGDTLETKVCDGIQIVSVPGLAKRVGEIAARFHGNPTGQMHLVGVTGTNGKTTCAYLTSQLLARHFGSAALMGTIGNGIWTDGDIELQETGLTTPDPVRLQADYARFRDYGVRAAAMEVSSHALSQGRVHGLIFDTAIFTNLSRDHLDYHGNMADYGAAKEKLFGLPKLKRGIINLDDPFGAQLAERCKLRNLNVITYGLQAGDLHVTDLCRHEGGFSVQLATPWGSGELKAPLIGDFNIHNALAVVAAAASAGMPFEAILATFPEIQPVPGRMERVKVDGTEDISVLVDYAHTPDALRAALAAARPYCRGNLWCVFGCGGDRDSGKRAPMGRIASEMADRTIVTSDNPRGEEPQKIIDDILEGAASNVEVEADRARAIQRAVTCAQPGDIILIAGKGHEDYQIIGSEKIHFCDREQAAAALQQRLAETVRGAGL